MLIGLLSVSSCMSEPEVTDYTTGEEMTFDVSTATATVTRASVNTGTTSLKNQSFKLFGDLNTSKVYINGEYFEGIKRIFDGTEVKYTGTCNYGTTQYWLMGQEYWFVALFPYSPQGVSDMSYDDSKLCFTYTLPSDLNNAVDLLAATDRRKFHFSISSTVTLNFKHLLSQISIQAALDEDLMYVDDEDYRNSDPDYEDEYIEFKRVDIYGAKTAATFTVAPAETLSTNPENTGIVNVKLIDNGADSKLSKPFSTPTKITNNNKLVSFFSNTDALLIIPQQFAADSEAKMVLTYTINGNTERERQIELPLAGYIWEGGKTYTYKFTVSKAYTGQIKEGSLTIEINDIIDPNANDRWISGGDKLEFEFDAPK